MTTKQRCILTDYRTDSCEGCTKLCQHRITLHGLTGEGGRVESAGVPNDYRYVTLGTSPARESQREIYEVLNKYVKTFDREDGERIKSFYLWSESPGTGKTTTAAALINAWISVEYLTALKDGRQPTPVGAYFLDVNEWQTDYNNFNRPRVPEDIAAPASERYYKAMGLAKSADFAVLDDIGVRDAGDAFRGDLHTVINHRTVNGMPTVYTSNLELAEMERVFDARLYDRMRDQCASLMFKGVSKRGRR